MSYPRLVQLRDKITDLQRVKDYIFRDTSVVVQRRCVDDVVSQLWRFEVVGAGDTVTEGRFVNAEHGECLDINNNALTDGAHVIRWLCGDNPNQIFRVSTDALEG